MTETFEELRALISSELMVDAESISPGVTFADLGAVSLDRIHITAMIEERFNIEISDDDVDTVESLADVLSLIEKDGRGSI